MKKVFNPYFAGTEAEKSVGDNLDLPKELQDAPQKRVPEFAPKEPVKQLLKEQAKTNST